jgi:hypothetical protein
VTTGLPRDGCCSSMSDAPIGTADA